MKKVILKIDKKNIPIFIGDHIITKIDFSKYIKGNGCVYVGQSSKKPEIRFEQHKEGYKSNKYAKYYGIKLRPDIYEKYNPIPNRKDAENIEEYLGKILRQKGIGVWFN